MLEGEKKEKTYHRHLLFPFPGALLPMVRNYSKVTTFSRVHGDYGSPGIVVNGVVIEIPVDAGYK